MSTCILVVDDEPALLDVMAPLLRSRGYEVTTASNATAAIDVVRRQAIDLIVLDLGLPDIDGIEVCRRIRQDSGVPVVVLSVREGETDKVEALDAGADDYVTKPFSAEELLARVRAALRRGDAGTFVSGQITRGDLTIDLDNRKVLRSGTDLKLTPREFELLLALVRHPGRVVTRRALLKAIWGRNAVDQPQHLRVLMRSLRKKIEPDAAKPRYLLTEPWIGYRFRDE